MLKVNSLTFTGFLVNFITKYIKSANEFTNVILSYKDIRAICRTCFVYNWINKKTDKVVNIPQL